MLRKKSYISLTIHTIQKRFIKKKKKKKPKITTKTTIVMKQSLKKVFITCQKVIPA